MEERGVWRGRGGAPLLVSFLSFFFLRASRDDGTQSDGLKRMQGGADTHTEIPMVNMALKHWFEHHATARYSGEPCRARSRAT